MAYVKGQSGNPGGASVTQKQAKQLIERLGLKAVRHWGRVLDGETTATIAEINAVAAIVAAYAFGRPKQQIQLDAKVEINNQAHLDALRQLVLDHPTKIIDAKPLEVLDNPTGQDKLDISAPMIERQNSARIGREPRDLDGAAAGKDPPPPVTTGGGGYDNQPPLALDDEDGPADR